MEVSLTRLHQLILAHFDERELAHIAAYLDVNYTELSGSNKASRVKTLIRLCERQSKIEVLINICRKQRKYAPWNEIFPDDSSNLPTQRALPLRKEVQTKPNPVALIERSDSSVNKETTEASPPPISAATPSPISTNYESGAGCATLIAAIIAITLVACILRVIYEALVPPLILVGVVVTPDIAVPETIILPPTPTSVLTSESGTTATPTQTVQSTKTTVSIEEASSQPRPTSTNSEDVVTITLPAISFAKIETSSAGLLSNRSTGNLIVEGEAVGYFQIDYPKWTWHTDAPFIIFKASFDKAFSYTATRIVEDRKNRTQKTDTIALVPILEAQLVSESFDINPNGAEIKDIVAAEWSWLIQPQQTGLQSLKIELAPSQEDYPRAIVLRGKQAIVFDIYVVNVWFIITLPIILLAVLLSIFRLSSGKNLQKNQPFNNQDEKSILLARALVDLINNNTTPEQIKALLQNGDTNSLLKELAGKEISVKGAVVSFGKENQFGDVTIRDIVGGNIVNLSLNIYLHSDDNRRSQ